RRKPSLDLAMPSSWLPGRCAFFVRSWVRVLNVAAPTRMLCSSKCMSKRVSISGCAAGFLTAGGLMFGPLYGASQQPGRNLPEPVAAHQSLVNRYCLSCHNERLKRGGLTLDAFVTHEVDRNPDVWEKVLR